MTEVRVIADTSVCIGAGQCVLTAPAIFDQDDEMGTVVLREDRVRGDAVPLVRRAVDLCPSGALSVTDIDPAPNR